ncbi:MAG: helix-turn-helix domain-containing protein [Bacteroidota bacterium]
MKERILQACADHFKCTVDDIKGLGRVKDIAKARTCAYFLLYTYWQGSPSSIARELCKNPGTVTRGIQRANNSFFTGDYVHDDIQYLEGILA